ncbi:MAG: DUF4339 domain-containing protein [Verrucomicrobia bacterium]|nr:DUF4339 domain-containing protein [Verrucomicrobiota bacterium]
MFKIIGADQKDYGPITAEQVRQWIAEGRANAQTRAQSDASPDWKPLGSFPEFADAFAAKAAASPQPQPVTSTVADALASEILARGYNVDFGHCIGRSWDLLLRHFWLVVGTSFLVSVVVGAVPFIGGVLLGGLFLFFLKLIRTGKAEVGDGFAGFSQAFLQLFLGGLVAGVLTAIGFALLIIPGIYLAVAWKFALPLIIDKRLDFWPAMELSRRVVTHNFWPLFVLLLMSVLLNCLGVLACVVGTFVTWPLTVGAIAYAYEDIFGARPTAQT